MNKIIRVFYDTDLRNGVDGLTAMAKKAGFDLTKLKPGGFLVFINTAATKLRVVPAPNTLLASPKPEGSVRFDHGSIFPKALQWNED